MCFAFCGYRRVDLVRRLGNGVKALGRGIEREVWGQPLLALRTLHATGPAKPQLLLDHPTVPGSNAQCMSRLQTSTRDKIHS